MQIAASSEASRFSFIYLGAILLSLEARDRVVLLKRSTSSFRHF